LGELLLALFYWRNKIENHHFGLFCQNLKQFIPKKKLKWVFGWGEHFAKKSTFAAGKLLMHQMMADVGKKYFEGIDSSIVELAKSSEQSNQRFKKQSFLPAGVTEGLENGKIDAVFMAKSWFEKGTYYQVIEALGSKNECVCPNGNMCRVLLSGYNLTING